MSYEPRDASLRAIGITAGLLAFGLVASIAASAWIYVHHFAPPFAIRGTLRQTSFTTGSQQRPDIIDDREAVIADAHRRLDSYGWVDRAAGEVHIPIERAMALFATGVQPAPAPNDAPSTP